MYHKKKSFKHRPRRSNRHNSYNKSKRIRKYGVSRGGIRL